MSAWRELLVLNLPPHRLLDGDLSEVELVEVVEGLLELLDVPDDGRVQGAGPGIVNLETSVHGVFINCNCLTCLGMSSPIGCLPLHILEQLWAR